MHYLLFYEKAPDYAERQRPYQAAHLEHVLAAVDRGDIVLAGNLDDPPDGAVLLFQASGPAVAEDFARADPYVQHGIVQRWHVRAWHTVVGAEAAEPLPR